MARSPRPATSPRGQSRRLALVGVAAVLTLLAIGGALAFRGPSKPPQADLAVAKSHEGFAGLQLTRVGGGPTGELLFGVTEVTEGQYLAVMRRSPAVWPKRLKRSTATPMDSVTWDEANAFCVKLTALDRTIPRGWVYRLPTEAEWEFACRAGHDGLFGKAEKLVYGQGGIFNPDAPGDRMGEEDVTRTKMERGLPYPAGTSDANPYGLRDCHGNVWEWTASPFEPRPDPSPGARRAQRGGSWREPASSCGCASRRAVVPDERHDDAGFRVVLAPSGGAGV